MGLAWVPSHFTTGMPPSFVKILGARVFARVFCDCIHMGPHVTEHCGSPLECLFRDQFAVCKVFAQLKG